MLYHGECLRPLDTIHTVYINAHIYTNCLWLLIHTYKCIHTRTHAHIHMQACMHPYIHINVLFNDALKSFYLRLYGVGHNMVKDHSDSERGSPLPPHGYSFRLAARVLLYAPFHRHIPRPLLHQSRSTGWNEKELNGSTPWRIDPTTHRTMSERSYHGVTSRSWVVIGARQNTLFDWQRKLRERYKKVYDYPQWLCWKIKLLLFHCHFS